MEGIEATAAWGVLRLLQHGGYRGYCSMGGIEATAAWRVLRLLQHGGY